MMMRIPCFKNLVVAVFLCGLSLQGFARQEERVAAHFPQDYPALHPRYRQWPVPAKNAEVSVNSPVLLWPATEKENITYDVRLSKDPGFGSPGTIYGNRIPWTIFNPHRALQPGTWYWQYRVHGRKWSDVQQFRIGAGVSSAVSPPAAVLLSAIPAAHPRVLLDKEAWPAFMRRTKQSEDARIILVKADAMLEAPAPDTLATDEIPHAKDAYKDMKLTDKQSKDLGFDALEAMELFCKAYLLTGDPKYADRGLLWADAVSRWDPHGQSGVSDFGNAGCMLAMALAFDTFHDRLTPSLRERLVRNIRLRAAGFYNDWVNDIDAKVLSNHVWQFILHYFFQTALAMHGELKEADDWLTYAYELWLARAPVLGGAEGGWLEGASYFRINMETLLDIPTVIKKYTGFDFINYHPWYDHNPSWMLASVPAGSCPDGFGDNVETMPSAGTDYLAYADALSKLTGNRVAATYAAKIEQTEKIKLTDADALRWFRLQYLAGAKRPAVLPDSALPSAIVLRDVGIVDMHSDIADVKNDLMISMRSSPYGAYGHMLADQNTFNVLYGGQRLFYMSGHKVAMKDAHRLRWYKATVGHNGILMDGKGQTFDPEGYGWIPRFLNGGEVTYAVGDASMAYGGRSKKGGGLQKFRRHLLFLRPNLLIVYDELAADHKARWSWLIHSPRPLHIDSIKNRFYCALPDASAAAVLLASQPVNWSLTDTFAVPVVNWMRRPRIKGYDNQWHLAAGTSQRSEKMRFLAVIQVNTGGRRSVRQLSYRRDDKNRIEVDGWTIYAELDTSKPAVLRAYRNDGKAAFTAGDDTLKAGSRTYTGKIQGSAKLAEMTDGRWIYKEEGEVIPAVVKEIPAEDKN